MRSTSVPSEEYVDVGEQLERFDEEHEALNGSADGIVLNSRRRDAADLKISFVL